ncbi:hypothetical protein KAV79_07415, partial [Candidatus Aerophobetes bacterium]|nr:hypothetical protein [Candidatus Aerophobetes bacterium]
HKSSFFAEITDFWRFYSTMAGTAGDLSFQWGGAAGIRKEAIRLLKGYGHQRIVILANQGTLDYR